MKRQNLETGNGSSESWLRPQETLRKIGRIASIFFHNLVYFF